MGQTWSGVDVSSLVTANERVRADSEPPTSTAGGHAVSRIPEEEEVNLRTSDIQYADWKKSSGILKEKSVQQPKRSRSMSLATAHLSDFSMFPDKYDSMPIRTPDNDAQAQTATPPSTPLSNLTAATAEWLFRNRASSTSEAMTARPDTAFGNSLKVPEQPETTRPRSASYSGRLPFFDFSMIPDKDPQFQEGRPTASQRRQSLAVPGAKPESNVSVDGSSLVAAALTMAASAPKESTATKPRTPTKPTNSTRFEFFDFSLIPDKDPKTFNAYKDRKED